MAFGNIAGRAGFVLGLDKSELDRGLPAAERQFDQSTRRMEQSASRAGDAVGTFRGGSAGVGLAGRIGLIGVAVNAGLQGLNAASKALEVTGSAAFTSEGKLRNLGASLAKGDIVGGLMAIARQPKTLQDLGLDAQNATTHLKELKTASDAFGGSATKIYEEALRASEGLDAMAKSTQVLGDVQRAVSANAAAFGPERGGVGAVAAGNAARAAAGDTFQAGTGGTSVGNTIRQSIASRIADDGARLRAQLAAAQVEERQARTTFQNVRGTPAAAAAYQRLVAATTAVAQLQNQIADNADQAAKAAAAAAAAKSRERDAAKAQAVADRKAAVEQGLENEIAKAALTKRKSDDKKAFDAAIDYWRSLAANAKNAKEREDAQKQLIDLRGRRAKALAGLDASETADDARQLRELRLANNVARAALTKRKDDDKRFLTDQLNYFLGYRKELLEAGEKLKAAQQTATIIGIRGQIAGLTGSTASATDTANVSSLLQAWSTVREKFAPNFQTHVLEHLTRQQTSVLKDAVEPARFRDTFPIGRSQGAVMDW